MQNIIDDMKRLGLPCDNITYTSDYFPQLKECGERLIKAGEWSHLGLLFIGSVQGGACGTEGSDCVRLAAPFRLATPLGSRAQHAQVLTVPRLRHIGCNFHQLYCLTAGHMYRDDTGCYFQQLWLSGCRPHVRG